MEHYLPSTPDNLHWRWRNGPPRPVIKIASGDRVTVETLSGEPDEVLDPAPEISVAPGETTEARADGPLLTGPIHIEDAEPGDILEVRVLDIELRSDWGWNLQISASNSMPDDLLDFCRRHVPLDRSRNVAHLPWGKELNLSPFFGNFGVASSTERRLFDLRNRRDLRGHIDNKDIGVGCAVYFPINMRGALFSVGEGHALLGDADSRLTTVDTALAGTFEFHVRRNFRLTAPQIEAATPSTAAALKSKKRFHLH
jgi:acetamidase/formamidase